MAPTHNPINENSIMRRRLYRRYSESARRISNGNGHIQLIRQKSRNEEGVPANPPSCGSQRIRQAVNPPEKKRQNTVMTGRLT